MAGNLRKDIVNHGVQVVETRATPAAVSVE